MASLYSAVNTRRDGRGAGSARSPPDEPRDCLSDGVDTRTRISDPTLGQEPPTHTGCPPLSLTKRGPAADDLNTSIVNRSHTEPVLARIGREVPVPGSAQRRLHWLTSASV